MLNIIVILTALVQSILGLFVYLKKRESVSNKAFGILTVATLAWAATNYTYTLNPVSSSALFLTRLVLFFVVIQNTVFYIFATNYPSEKLVFTRRRLLLLVLLSLPVALLTLSPFVFKSVTITHGQATPNPGPGIALFMAHAVFTCGLGIRHLIRKMRISHGQSRKQLQFILFASILNWAIVPVTNFVITLAFKTSFFARVSPFYTLVFAAIIGYSIVAHHLFDIRAAVTRSVGYVLSLGSTAIIYGSVVFVLGRRIFVHDNASIGFQAFYLTTAIIVALTYPALKNYFDRLSNRIFYRETYDPQSVLSELNRVLVGTTDLDPLLKSSTAVIKKNLKASFCDIAVYMDKKHLRFTNTKEYPAHQDLLEVLSGLGPNALIITDNIADPNAPLYKVLQKNKIAMILGLITQQGLVGYIILGDKLDGIGYGESDTRLLKLIVNELAIATQNALRFEQIENFNLTLQQKVNDATRELRRSNEKLKALDEAKDEFISMASHQLRTPLTSVKGYLSMLEEGDAGKLNATQKQFVAQAFVSSQRMVYLIADLLNVSRLKTGKFVIEAHPIYLPDVVESEIAQLYETVKSRGLVMHFDKPASFPTLNLDETKIRQVVMNFADNAIYYTPNGGEIRLSLTETPDSVEFAVKDSGIGVPKTEQHHLFTKFYRAGNARKTRPDGTGLGLFMAKKVIVAQGGSLIFKSQEGKGSTFGFQFAKKAVVVQPLDSPKA